SVISGRSLPAISAANLAWKSAILTTLKLTVALSCLLTSCQAGFCSSGVGGRGRNALVKISTLLPLPGGVAGSALTGLAGYLLKPSSYSGPLLGMSGLGPVVAGT